MNITIVFVLFFFISPSVVSGLTLTHSKGWILSFFFFEEITGSSWLNFETAECLKEKKKSSFELNGFQWDFPKILLMQQIHWQWKSPKRENTNTFPILRFGALVQLSDNWKVLLENIHLLGCTSSLQPTDPFIPQHTATLAHHWLGPVCLFSFQ